MEGVVVGAKGQCEMGHTLLSVRRRSFELAVAEKQPERHTERHKAKTRRLS